MYQQRLDSVGLGCNIYALEYLDLQLNVRPNNFMITEKPSIY